VYAIISTGGKQIKVAEGDVIQCERIKGAKIGDTVEFDEVLSVVTDEGAEFNPDKLADAKVVAEVVGEEKGRKITIYKMRRRKNYRRKTGHRQLYHQVRINKILLPQAK